MKRAKEPKTVLVVEDSSTIRKLTALALKVKGFKVLTASDGMEAIELMTTNPVDLLITDLNMPNIDGFELIRLVRENPDFSSIPIIILSSEDSNENIERGMKLGANSYLTKPFVADTIQAEVLKYIE